MLCLGCTGIRSLLFNTVPTVYHSLPSYTHPIAAVVRAIARSLSRLVCTTSKVAAAAWPREQHRLQLTL